MIAIVNLGSRFLMRIIHCQVQLFSFSYAQKEAHNVEWQPRCTLCVHMHKNGEYSYKRKTWIGSLKKRRKFSIVNLICLQFYGTRHLGQQIRKSQNLVENSCYLKTKQVNCHQKYPNSIKSDNFAEKEGFTQKNNISYSSSANFITK